MSVAAHLKIQIEDYDRRIRTFVPDYEEMIQVTADALRLLVNPSPAIVDLGIGTGALAAQCLHVCPDARLLGMDLDPAMLEAAQLRLAHHAGHELLIANFLDAELPNCDAIVASIALHHVPKAGIKRRFYAKCQRSLAAGGFLVTADHFPGREVHLASRHREAWLEHLQQSYTRGEAEDFLAAWAKEDRYFPLEAELQWLRKAGFTPEVLWRKAGFAVIIAFVSGT